MENFEKIFLDDVSVIVVHLIGSTFLETNKFKKIIEEQIHYGYTNLVIDLSKCKNIDSTFFGAIIMALRMMEGKGYKLKVVEPSNPGEDIFNRMKTLGLFDLYKTRKDAIKSFENNIQPES